MIKLIIGIFLLPLLFWLMTLLPLPASVPNEVVVPLATALGYVWALNQILPIDTLFTLFLIGITLAIMESLLHFGVSIIKLLKH